MSTQYGCTFKNDRLNSQNSLYHGDNHSNSYENMHVFLYSLLCMVIFQAKGRNIFDQVSRKCVIYQQSEQDEKALD